MTTLFMVIGGFVGLLLLLGVFLLGQARGRRLPPYVESYREMRLVQENVKLRRYARWLEQWKPGPPEQVTRLSLLEAGEDEDATEHLPTVPEQVV